MYRYKVAGHTVCKQTAVITVKLIDVYSRRYEDPIAFGSSE
jgi:hypothetical protein